MEMKGTIKKGHNRKQFLKEKTEKKEENWGGKDLLVHISIVKKKNGLYVWIPTAITIDLEPAVSSKAGTVAYYHCH